MSKIYELAEQAAEHAVLNYSGEVLQSETDDATIQIPKEFIDKFAELIVQEAIGVAEKQRNPQNLNYKPSERFVEELRLHFGVYDA